MWAFLSVCPDVGKRGKVSGGLERSHRSHINDGDKIFIALKLVRKKIGALC